MATLRKILKEMKGYYRYLVIAFFAMLILTATQLYYPLITRELVSLIETGSPDLPKRAVALGGILLGVYFLQSLCTYFKSYYAHYAAWNCISDLRIKLYDHIQYLSMSYFQDKQVGQLMSRITADSSNIEVLVAHALPDTIINLFLFAGAAVILFSINPLLATLTLLTLPLTGFVVWIYSTKVRPLFRFGHVKMGELNAVLQDNLSGMKEIQVFNQQKEEKANVGAKSQEHVKYLLGALRKSAIFQPFISFVNNLGSVVIVIAGGILAFHGKLMASDIVAFMMYSSLFYQPMMMLGRIVEDMQNALTAADRIFEVLDTHSEVQDRKGAVPIGAVKGDLSFEHVDFSYEEKTKVLREINLQIKSGETVALVGPTGVGKTTFVHLITRFYDPDSGRILLDGKDLREITLKSLRDHISIVLQDVFLFNGTVLENIAYGCKDASREAVVQAAKIANADEFIRKMEAGYDTVIGERGTKLSGGQKQRLSIARAILRNREILILDEATAAVDTATERLIQEAIEKVSRDRTTIIIAHRLSTIKNADRIVVLSESGIEQIGKHEELMQTDGSYRKLVLANQA